jgi:hypothetical protein
VCREAGGLGRQDPQHARARLTEGASTRLLIRAARLIGRGGGKDALRTTVCLLLTDDERLLETLYDLIEDVF